MTGRMFPYDDFEAKITILPAEVSGRRSPVFNGIRWDIIYDDHPSKMWMVWPEFLTEDGTLWPKDRMLPKGSPLTARMLVLDEELRASFHRGHVRAGLAFGCYEGGHRVADAVVTSITGLHDPRPYAAARPAE